ncbi:E3 ubiquitin-protein ligase RHF2A isoform X1 [Spinacia oleracea]|uniref:RING-type E3 ubiquitin transferase n=2 Tax=Spinacia oleracea TaxID=3562 RepID=A0ABM3QTK1_SPIOL|nr:E3 ubiquitin-protein ligase RHF2A-like isoform X1 [Spinacia oleracea]
MDTVRESYDHSTNIGTFLEGEMQGACDDACSICLEDFSESDPSTVTDCKHEFHLHCILEWCHRSSNCPMCWRPISLKDEASQQLLESVEHERSLRANRSRNRTSFYHPSLENLEVHLPTDVGEVDLEEHIFQHLAAAAAMRSGHLVFRREGQRSWSSSSGHHPFFVFSSSNALHDGSILNSMNPVGDESHSPSVSLGSATILSRSSSDAPVPVSLPPPQTDEGYAHRIRSNFASANRQSVLSETRSLGSQSFMRSQNTAEQSELQSESLRSRFNSWSMRYKECISRNTRGWKERLFARSTSMAELGTEVRREVNSGIARMMERLDSRMNNGSDRASQSSHAGRTTTNDYSND